MKVLCPHCNQEHEVNPARLLRAISSPARTEAAKTNGAKGGRPAKHRIVVKHEDNGSWHWQVLLRKKLIGAGYCATSYDAQNDAAAIVRKAIIASHPAT